MAQIIIKGEREPILVSNKRAETIQHDWLNGTLADVIKIDDLVIDKRSIKAIYTDNNYENTKEKRYPDDYTTDEIKEIIGDFEKEHEANCTGEIIRHPVLGVAYEGVVNWAKEKGWITDNALTENSSWFKFYWGMKELQARREFAEKKEQEAFETITR